MTQADTEPLRRMLAEQLLNGGRIRSREVAEAFREVPRHLFVPDAEPARAYADEAIPVKWAADGRPLSSSSQPAIMAIMLEQLGLRPGMRVLEIGTGTGYNAALLTHLVGATGAVVTVDIDEELAGTARQRLTAAGYSSVMVADGDGAAGWPAGAPYDRIVVTAAARDLAPAWTGQLGDGGRLVVPLSLRGIQHSVAFKQSGDHLASVSVVPCGFMPLTGELAAGDPARPFGQMPGVFLSIEDHRELDLAALRAALNQPGRALPTGVTINQSYLFAGLGLWLALHYPGVGELAAVGPAAGRGHIPSLITHIRGRASTTVLAGETSLAAVARLPGAEQATDFEAHVRGYGPDGDRLAERLATGIRDWDSAGRPAGSTLRIRVSSRRRRARARRIHRHDAAHPLPARLVSIARHARLASRPPRAAPESPGARGPRVARRARLALIPHTIYRDFAWTGEGYATWRSGTWPRTMGWPANVVLAAGSSVCRRRPCRRRRSQKWP